MNISTKNWWNLVFSPYTCYLRNVNVIIFYVVFQDCPLRWLSVSGTVHDHISWLAWLQLSSRETAFLTLSGHMLIYNRHGDSVSTDECWYMFDKVSFAVLQSYVDHMSLLATVFCANTFMNVLSAFCHLEWHLYIVVCHMLVACFYFQLNLSPLDWGNWVIIPCVMQMKNLVVVC
jgi:hypothetical protein